MDQQASKKEYRTLPLTELRIRTDESGPPTIEGHAAVFDSWSETLGGIFPFKEKIRKGAFQKSLGKDDIRALFNHDANYVLGRNRAGTLSLKEDDQGLFVSIIPPDTTWAHDLTVSIKRGDITQMSFGFVVIEDEWRDEQGMDVRELLEVQLYDVSPVTFPAYTQTDVGVRAMQQYELYKGIRRTETAGMKKLAERAKEKGKLFHLKTKFKNL